MILLIDNTTFCDRESEHTSTKHMSFPTDYAVRTYEHKLYLLGLQFEFMNRIFLLRHIGIFCYQQSK